MTKRAGESTARALRSANVATRLAEHSAVVLERIARAAGQTRWFYLERPEQLPLLARELGPGSSVLFMFDDRFQRMVNEPEAVAERAVPIIESSGGAVIGRLDPGTIELVVDFPSSHDEVLETANDWPASSHLFLGAFPRPDDSDDALVHVLVPDVDGIVRRHPH